VIELSGVVLQNRPTKGGNWHRVVVAGSGRVNDLLMVPSGSGEAALVKGQTLGPVAVRAAVETTAEGRPTRAIVYWLDGAEAA
jgi:hypothetical protein